MTGPVPKDQATLVLIDANGDVTQDRAKAVRGEVLEQLPDGSTRSTLFTLDRELSVPTAVER